MNTSTIIPITELRRRFGEITANLPFIDRLILTKDGKPFAILKSAPEVKRALLKKTAGSLKNTEFEDATFVKKMLKKKSRSRTISLE